ncbi:MAG: NAD-glutamate dehydrogenase, partial [Lentisphaeria bacterium]|nr:NAD-glutamate dehydrogenase [Lentisphaeria bacterium]
MNTDSVTFERSISIGERAGKMGLDTNLLYESVIEIAEEGMLTAHSVNAAAQILLGELGLPEYCFQNIDADTLKSVLRVLATNIRPGPNGRYLLNSQEAPLLSGVVDGIQILLASDEARERTDQAAGTAVGHKHWEYYHCHRNHYHTYVIKPGSCPSLEEVAAGASPFSMVQSNHGFHVPAETRLRYETFLKQHKASVGRRIHISPCEATMETRIMFHKNIDGYWLSIMRRRFEELGLRITRAYGEPYRTDTGTIASVCSIYVLGELDEDQCAAIGKDLRAMLALPPHTFAHLYLGKALTFEQMLFAVNASCFIHQFIYIEQETDRKLMDSLKSERLRAALARRIARANRNEHTRHVITETLRENPDLVRTLFKLFDARFNPEQAAVYDAHEQDQQIELFDRGLQIRFSDDSTALDIFRFACRLITDTLKTNFYKLDRRSYSFRLDSTILDPIVFPETVFGIFFVLGHHSLGTHMRAEDIARGGLRLLRVTAANYDNQLDDANLLNYALGPRAQRLKHKDIAESGAKGVIVPTPNHAYDGLNAVFDYSEGILDLILPSSEIVDHYGKPEMIFFGPDEGTA